MPGLLGSRMVDYARVRGLQSQGTDGTIRTTGASYVVGLPKDYTAFAPGQLRLLTGNAGGPVLQQQTASTLAAQPGATITILGGSGPPVRVTGVADLPHADSFFQTVGSTATATVAAPDNVLLVPEADVRIVDLRDCRRCVSCTCAWTTGAADRSCGGRQRGGSAGRTG